MGYYTLKLCSGRGSFEATPRPRAPIDLAEARRRLEAEGVAVVDARVMLIARLDCEVTVSRDGRLLLKSPDADVAERTFARLRSILGLPEARAEERAARPRAEHVPS